MFKTMLGFLSILTVSNTWAASEIDCRFGNSYAHFTGARLSLEIDSSKHSQVYASGTQLGNLYYLIEETAPQNADTKVNISINLKRGITFDTFESVLTIVSFEPTQSCWDGCDNVTWGWEAKEQKQGICQMK